MSLTLETLLGQINAYQAAETRLPKEVVDQYLKLSHEKGGPGDQAYAIYLKADELGDSGRFCEAIVTYEEGLRKHPEDLRLQRQFPAFLRNVSRAVEAIGRRDPADAEFGRSFERLVEVGEVSVQMHQAAITHYRLTGKIEHACALALKLHAVAPNFPGLTGEIKFLCELSDNVLLQAIIKKGK